jgi:hypothetical protein
MATPTEIGGNLATGFAVAMDDYGNNYDLPYEEGELPAVDLNPTSPTPSKPGSSGKVVMLAARYAAGLPLWHDEDCRDHGPGAIADLLDEKETDE